MNTPSVLLTILLLSTTLVSTANEHKHYPETMQSDLMIETSRGKNIGFLELYFRDVHSVSTIFIEHSISPDTDFTFIRKIWGVDIAHGVTNKFIVMDTQLTELNNPTYYRISLVRSNGNTETYYATLPGE